MEIILVRHSIAQGNPERRFLGVTDTPLLPEGIALAKRRAAVMPPVEHVYVSPLRRACETAALLWPCIPETIVPGLREMDFGAFENRTHAELVAANDRAYLEWLAQERWDGYPGGETFSAMRMRVVAACGHGSARRDNLVFVGTIYGCAHGFRRKQNGKLRRLPAGSGTGAGWHTMQRVYGA